MGKITPDNDEKKLLLKARAALLSLEPKIIDAEEDKLEIVEFLLAGERYAIESMYIGEVAPLRNLTELPCTPAFVRGVINMHGKIIAVIDLRTFFDLPIGEISDSNKVVVLRNDTKEFGIMADVIIDTRWFPRTALLPSLPMLTGIRTEYLMGVTQDRLVILDGSRILSDFSLEVHEEVPAPVETAHS